MKAAGQIALVPFPYSDLATAKLRPVLLLCPTPGRHADWLVCMVSSRLHQAEPGFDEMLVPGEADFADSGLKTASVLRLARLAVVEDNLLVGSLGRISETRLSLVRQRLAGWLAGTPSTS